MVGAKEKEVEVRVAIKAGEKRAMVCLSRHNTPSMNVSLNIPLKMFTYVFTAEVKAQGQPREASLQKVEAQWLKDILTC